MVHDDVPRLHDRSGRTPAAPPATVQPAYEDLDPDTQVFDVYTGTAPHILARSGAPPRPEPAPSSLWPATVSRSSGRAAGHPGVCPVIRPSAVLVARGGSASGSPTGTSMRTEPAWANVNVTG